ncbi:unnamed protein product [marine sediment metagenome]|uniref:Uncharacterized protein n=1 Tax=marine sediment metagenome TaxID=412755 RepID=X1H7N7_9ZZZZ
MPGLTNEATGTATSCAVEEIFDLVNATLTLRETGEVLLADGTEQNTYVSNTPLGVHKPIVEFISLDEMIGGDTTVIRVYYRLAQGGGWLLTDYQSYTGINGGLANSVTVIAVDLLPNRFGIRVTLTQTAGGMRQYLWKYFGDQ